MTSSFPERNATKPAARPVVAMAGARRKSGVLRKMLEAQKRERVVILSELVKIRGLMPLLMKHRNGETWSGSERFELQDRLRALAHISPYLIILLLPGSFAFLPALAWWLDRRRLDRTR